MRNGTSRTPQGTAFPASPFSAVSASVVSVSAAVHFFFAAPVGQKLIQNAGELFLLFLIQAGEEILYGSLSADVHLFGGFQARGGESDIHASFILFIRRAGDISFGFHFSQDFT